MTQSRKLINVAYVLSFLALFGFAVAYGSPYWTYFHGSYYGVITYCHGSYCHFKTHIFRNFQSFLFPAVYTLGFVSSLAVVIISSILICRHKSKGYKFCFASGTLALLAVVFVVTVLSIISVEADIQKQHGHYIQWAFLLAIFGVAFELVASILFFAAGYKQKRCH